MSRPRGKPFYRLTIGDRRLILLEEAGADGPELLVYLEPGTYEIPCPAMAIQIASAIS